MSTVDVDQIIKPDDLACEIVNRYTSWKKNRSNREEQWVELRNYLYATDTTTTTNKNNDWHNTTTTPKLRQIADNLQANYMGHLFPNEDWFRWEGDSQDDDSTDTKRNITNYIKTKTKRTDFIPVIEDCLEDWHSRYGECFATVIWEDQVTDVGAYKTTAYRGPRVVRISPYDIVYNPTATSWEKTPKIVRSMLSLGEVKRLIEQQPDKQFYQDVFDKMLLSRREAKTHGEIRKADAYVADGFSTLHEYYESGNVEILTFFGDLYHTDTGEFYENQEIVVADRAYVIKNSPVASWLGTSPIVKSNWRNRPDNLHGMSALENLVGLQYRLDALENSKADVWDQIAFPVRVHKGYVEDYEWYPGCEITVGDDGSVDYLVPDATALQADLMIDVLERRMEEMAGAPRTSMGIRTPGEKTAFEVQTLDNSGNRLFENKAAYFERTFIEKILNMFLDASVRNMRDVETIREYDKDTQTTLFSDIKKEDIVANGKLMPIGARYSKERATRLQNLAQISQQKQIDPTIAPHLSGKLHAQILATELGEEKLYGENIAVEEQKNTQTAVTDAQVEFEAEQEELAGIPLQDEQ